jgi:hypothetical protein
LGWSNRLVGGTPTSPRETRALPFFNENRFGSGGLSHRGFDQSSSGGYDLAQLRQAPVEFKDDR